MPIIEDVTYNADEDKFQKKIIVRYWRKGKGGRMYKSENSLIRPRRVQGTWTQPAPTQISSSIFRLTDFQNDGRELALALPMDTYKYKRKSTLENTRNATKILFRQFENYCDKTTLHGLRYVGDASLSVLERLFWVVAFGSAFAFAAYYIAKIFEKWNTNPVIVAFNPVDATFNDIPFPAITICNMNQVKRTEAERINQEQNPAEKQLLSDYCNFSNDTERQTLGWDVIQKFLIQVGQSCSDTIKSCFWQGDNISCEQYFNNDLTDEGLCCSFNRLPADKIFRSPKDMSYLNHSFQGTIYEWSPEVGFPHPNDGDINAIPIRPSGAGSHLGLTLVVDAQLDNYYCSSTNSYGFKIMLYNPVETPKISDYGFLVSPGVEARYVIKPEIREATPTLRSVDISKRQCYFQDERPLKYYRSYTKRNCRLECQANHTLLTCDCISYFLPKNKTVRVCGKSDEKCVAQAKEDMELIYGNGSSCKCLPSCYELNFEKSSTYSDLFSMGSLYHVDNVPSNEYFKKNMAILHFFFAENKFRRQIKSEIFGFTEVLSNVGGLLGLCLGFSVLSLVELIYFLTLKVLCGYVQTRKKGHKKKEKNEQGTNNVIPFMS